MLAWALVADASVDLAVAVGYGAVAWRSVARGAGARDDASDAERVSASGLAVWWWALACTGLLAAVLSVLALVRPNLALFGATSFLVVVAFTVGMAGLVTHLATITLGDRPAVRVGIFAAYGAYFAIQAWLLVSTVPAGIVMQGWRPVLDTPPGPAWVSAASLVLMLLPPLAGALLYAWRRGAGAKLLAGGLVLWLASVLLIAEPALADGFAWQAASRALVLLSAAAIHHAYERGDARWSSGSSPTSA
jgi:hypothetical protein